MFKLSDEELINELKKRFTENQNSLRELQELSTELQSVNKKLEESEALKSNFLSNIRNEIINPFASIMGLSENILNTEDLNKIRSMAYMIYNEAYGLDFQLKNIFAAAEIEAGEAIPQICKVDILSIIENIVETYIFIAKQKNIKIESLNEIEHANQNVFYFLTDSEKIQLIFSNIICNAILYSNENSKILVKIWKSDNELKISVKDNGKGISKANQELIFDRFKRLDNSINTPNRGHGLGLAVVKSYLDLLNGTITLISNENEGTEFVIIIPESNNYNSITDISTDSNEFYFDNKDMTKF